MSHSLSIDTHCQMLTTQIIYRTERIYDAFKSFVTTFSGLTGAALAIKLQYGMRDVQQYFLLADGLALLLAITTIFMIVENSRSWYNLRKKLSTIAGQDENLALIIAAPSIQNSTRVEAVMLLVVVVATIAFMTWNPLR